MTCGGEHIWNRQHNLSRRLQNMKSLPLSVSLIVNIIVTCSKSRDKSHGHNSVLCRNCGQGWICCQKFGRKIGFWEENSGKTRNLSIWQNYDKMPIFLLFSCYIFILADGGNWLSPSCSGCHRSPPTSSRGGTSPCSAPPSSSPWRGWGTPPATSSLSSHSARGRGQRVSESQLTTSEPA